MQPTDATNNQNPATQQVNPAVAGGMGLPAGQEQAPQAQQQNPDAASGVAQPGQPQTAPAVRVNPMFPIHVASVPDVDLGGYLDPKLKDFVDAKAKSESRRMGINVSMNLAGKGMTTSDVAKVRLEAQVMRSITGVMNEVSFNGGYIEIESDQIVERASKAASRIVSMAGGLGDTELKGIASKLIKMQDNVTDLQNAYLASAKKPPENKWRNDDLIAMGVAMLLMPGGAGEIYEWFEQRKNQRYQESVGIWQNAQQIAQQEIQFRQGEVAKLEEQKKEIIGESKTKMQSAEASIKMLAEQGLVDAVQERLMKYSTEWQEAGGVGVPPDQMSTYLEIAKRKQKEIADQEADNKINQETKRSSGLQSYSDNIRQASASGLPDQVRENINQHNILADALGAPERKISEEQAGKLVAEATSNRRTNTMSKLKGVAEMLARNTGKPYESIFTMMINGLDQTTLQRIAQGAEMSLEDKLKVQELVNKKATEQNILINTKLKNVDLKYAEQTKQAMIQMYKSGAGRNDAVTAWTEKRTGMLDEEQRLSQLRLLIQGWTALRVTQNNASSVKMKEWEVTKAPAMKAVADKLSLLTEEIMLAKQTLAVEPNNKEEKARLQFAEGELQKATAEYQGFINEFQAIAGEGNMTLLPGQLEGLFDAMSQGKSLSEILESGMLGTDPGQNDGTTDPDVVSRQGFNPGSTAPFNPGFNAGGQAGTAQDWMKKPNAMEGSRPNPAVAAGKITQPKPAAAKPKSIEQEALERYRKNKTEKAKAKKQAQPTGKGKTKTINGRQVTIG